MKSYIVIKNNEVVTYYKNYENALRLAKRIDGKIQVSGDYENYDDFNEKYPEQNIEL